MITCTRLLRKQQSEYLMTHPLLRVSIHSRDIAKDKTLVSIMLLKVLIFVTVVASCACSKYAEGNQMKTEQMENPFRMSKINAVWQKAQKAS